MAQMNIYDLGLALNIARQCKELNFSYDSYLEYHASLVWTYGEPDKPLPLAQYMKLEPVTN